MQAGILGNFTYTTQPNHYHYKMRDNSNYQTNNNTNYSNNTSPETGAREMYEDNYLPPINYPEVYTRSNSRNENGNTIQRSNSFRQQQQSYLPSYNDSGTVNYTSNYSGVATSNHHTPKSALSHITNDPEHTLIHPSDVRKTTTTKIISQKWNNQDLNSLNYNDPPLRGFSADVNYLPSISDSYKQKFNTNNKIGSDPSVYAQENMKYNSVSKRPSTTNYVESKPNVGNHPQSHYTTTTKSKTGKSSGNTVEPHYGTNEGDLKVISSYPSYNFVNVYPNSQHYDAQYRLPALTSASNPQIQTFSVPQVTKKYTRTESGGGVNTRTLSAPYIANNNQIHQLQSSNTDPLSTIPSYNSISGSQNGHFQPPSPRNYNNNNVIYTNAPPSPGRPSSRRTSFNNNTNYHNVPSSTQNAAAVPQTNYIQPVGYPAYTNNQQQQQHPPVTYQPSSHSINFKDAHHNNHSQFNTTISRNYSNNPTPHSSPSFKGLPKSQSISKLWQIHPSELDFGTTPIVLGSGTFGVVHLAKLRGDMVAVKIPKMGLEDFQKEKDILLSLRHRNIVLCQGEVHLPNGQQGIVLEYMALGTLKDFIEKNRILSDEQKLSLAQCIAKGLAFLHGEQIFHRDLSHNNVLIDDTGTAKITDFGKAKPQSHVLGTSGTIGTYLWMPPEAFSGSYSCASDIFSLGILMWEIETGNTNPGPPNQDTSDISTVINWRKGGGIPKMKEDGILTPLIQKCLRSDPACRPTAVQCVDALSHLQQYLYKK